MDAGTKIALRALDVIKCVNQMHRSYSTKPGRPLARVFFACDQIPSAGLSCGA